VFSLLLTPFDDNREIDWRGYERYVAWQLDQGPDGVFAVCGSSEMKWLSLEERLRLAQAAVKQAGRIPVVATANLEPEPARHGEEIRRIADTGVAGVVLVPQPGLGENQDRLGEYFGRLIDGAPCPALVYEWPMVKPYLLEARIYAGLVRDHGVAGIKYTTCTMEGIAAKVAVRGDSTVFQANAPFLAESVRAGAGGIMAITTTAAADLAIRFWKAATGSPAREAAAASLHAQLVLLDCALERGGAYPASAKHLATLRGLPMGTTCRNPVRLAPECRKAVEVWLSQSGL
jgi:4-hydroxy-tetrahydrodipicolinate synthase